MLTATAAREKTAQSQRKTEGLLAREQTGIRAIRDLFKAEG